MLEKFQEKLKSVSSSEEPAAVPEAETRQAAANPEEEDPGEEDVAGDSW